MATIPKLIKAALALGRALPEQILALGYAVLKGLTGNANFTSLPVDLAVLKAALGCLLRLYCGGTGWRQESHHRAQ